MRFFSILLLLSILFSCSNESKPDAGNQQATKSGSDSLITQNPLPVDSGFLDADTVYNWYIDGLNLRSGPNQDAEIIAEIPFGDCMLTKDTLEFHATDSVCVKIGSWMNEDSKRVKICGSYIRVHYQGKNGYVFNGYTSFLKPFSLGEQVVQPPLRHILEKYFLDIGLFDKLDRTDTTGERSEMPYYSGDITSHYHNGGTFTSNSNEYGSSGTFMVPGMSVREGYLLFLIMENVHPRTYTHLILYEQNDHKINLEDFDCCSGGGLYLSEETVNGKEMLRYAISCYCD